jgi:hypothetical protein
MRFDEANLAENEAWLAATAPRMRIDEPKTPYHGSRSGAPPPSDAVRAAGDPQPQQPGAVPYSFIDTSFIFVLPSPPASLCLSRDLLHVIVIIIIAVVVF